MRRISPALAGLILAVSAGAAWAEFRPLTPSGGGSRLDSGLTYQDGVVYHDALAPRGRPPQDLRVGGPEGDFLSPREEPGDIPPNSPQLIGPDGKLKR